MSADDRPETMNITLEPTPELYDAPINGVKVPVRIWAGHTSAGIPIEAYVLTITPDNKLDAERLAAELPPFMLPSRHLYKIDVGGEEADEREKLLRARAEVIEVMQRHNLIGHVVMAGQLGRAEVIMHLDAPWSKLMLEPHKDGHIIRLRSKAADYGGDKQAQQQDLESTLGALSLMATMTGTAAMQMLEVSARFDEATGAKHSGLKREHKQ